MHKLGWIDKYTWIKPSPGFLRFAFPELPRSFIKAQSAEVKGWIKQNLPGHTWADAMYDVKQSELLGKSFQGLNATRFGRLFSIEVQELDPDILPLGSIGCITLCKSPGFTPIKADSLYESIARDSTPN